MSKRISCMGLIGDGCGGGREFFIEDEQLFSYDSYSKESLLLDEGIKNAKSISKNRCILTIECEDEVLKFDLSELKRAK